MLLWLTSCKYSHGIIVLITMIVVVVSRGFRKALFGSVKGWNIPMKVFLWLISIENTWFILNLD